jgi:hypothetical protein
MIQVRRQSLFGVRNTGAALLLAGLIATGATVGTGIAPALAQDDATPTAAMVMGVPTVTVSGHGEVNVPPDTASVTIGVDIVKPTLDEAQQTATTQANAVIDALKEAGIKSEDIQTEYYSVNILRDYSENADPNVITGFEIVNQLNVTVRDTTKLGELLDAAVSAGANSIYGVTFFVDDQTQAASDARVKAVDDARTKAGELASASGLTLGPVVAISEGTVGGYAPVYGRAMGGGMGAAEAAVPVESGSTTVSVDITMTFELR